MAGEAFRLVIPQDMLNKLQTADDKLAQLGKTSQTTQSQVINAFRSMADGVNPFIQKLNEAQQALSNIKAFKGGDIKLGNIATEATKSADAVNELVRVIAKLVQENKKLQEQQLSSRGITIAQEGTLSKKESNLNYKSLTNDVKELHNAEMERGRELTRQNSQNIANQRVFREQLKQETNAKIAEARKASADIQILSKEEIAAWKRASNERIANDNDASKRRIAQQKRETNEIIAELNRESRERIKEANRIARLTRLPSTIDTATAQNIISKSGSAVSINQMLTSIKNLEKAKKDLDTTDKNYKKTLAEIDNAINKNKQSLRQLGVETENVRKHQSNLMNHAQQLRRALALAFSVSQITGYINKMIQVRGEFELQQRSLQAILQNKDEADKLWQQTVDLAVRSPFRVKELVTYTKQLAAYRIETEKLHDTTKMLSDVSAGLGVDMQRLILAYGQVKAANYLRGTELRQFSEAGINILGELAKYFTELEGRAVSVGEVFERVSKRMVAFSDVEEIFKRVTSEGGVFYRMQEIQAETVKGLISNLYDQVDLMLNDIGKSNDGMLKGAIGLVKEFVENWKDVVDAGKAWLVVLSPLIARTLLFKAANSGLAISMLSLFNSTNFGLSISMSYGRWLVNLEQKSKVAAWAVRGLTTAMRGLATIGLTALGVGLVYWITELYLEMTKASREAERLRKELNDLVSQDVGNLDKAVDGYKNLYTRLDEVNKGSIAHKDIIQKLNSEYGEYLNYLVNENTTMQQLAESYDEVVKRMREKQAFDTFEKGMSAIAESYGNSLTEAKDSFYELFEGASIKSSESDFKFLVPTKKEIDDIYSLIMQKTRELEADQMDSYKEQSDIIQSIVREYYGDEFSLSRNFYESIELIDILVDKKKKEKELQDAINLQYKQTLSSREANLALEKLQLEYAEKRREIEGTAKTGFDKDKALESLKMDEELAIIDLKLRFNIISKEGARKEKDKIINWATDVTKSINETLTKGLSDTYTEEEISKVLRTRSGQETKNINEYLKDIKSAWEQQNATIIEQISLKSEGLQVDENLLNNAIRLEALYRKAAELLGIELKYEQRINAETRKSINDRLPLEYQITLEESLKSQTTLLGEANKKKEEAIRLQAMLNAAQEYDTTITEEELKKADDEVKYWTERWKLLGGEEEEKKGGSTRSNSLYDERIKVIDDMNKKYKELNKTLDRSTSLQGAFEAYIDAFATAFAGISWIPKNVRKMSAEEFASNVLNFPNEDELVKFLDKLAKEPMKTFEKIKVELAKGEYVMDMKVEFQQEQDQNIADQIADMFSGYELSLELQKLNIPPDLANQLLGFEPIELDEIRDKILKKYNLGEFSDKTNRELFDSEAFKAMSDNQKETLRKALQDEEKLQIEHKKKLLQQFKDYLKNATEEILLTQEEGVLYIALAKEYFDKGLILAEEYGEAIKRITNEVNEKVSEINLKKFKESSIYIKGMGDLAGYTKSELQDLIKEVNNLIAKSSKSMSPKEIKEYFKIVENAQSAIEKMELPWNNNAISQAIQLIALQKELAEEKKNLLKEEAELEKLKADLISKQNSLQTAKNAGQDTTKLQTDVDDTINKIGEKEGKIGQISGKISQIGGQIGKIAGGASATLTIVDKIITAVYQSIQATVKMFNDFKALAKSRGIDTDSESWSKATKKIETLDKFNNRAMSGWNNLKSLNVAGAVADTAGSVANLLQGLNELKDIDNEKRIERETKLVEKLEKAYDKLGETIQNAYSLDTLNEATQMSRDNLTAQISATERMIEAEKSKKDTDWERIEEWQELLGEYKETMKELEETRLQELGAFASDENKKSGAQAFLDAWMEAYKETGDGLSGLNEQFDEFFEDMIKKQMLQRGANKFLEPFFNTFDTAIANWADGKIADKEALDAIDKAQQYYLPQLSHFWTKLAEIFGVAEDLAGSTAELGGLQAGIQGITEDQADVLASYMSSVRLYVADNNAKFTDLITRLFDSEGSSNPMLAELRAQTAFIQEIRDVLGSVVRGGHSMGGTGLKVFIS